MSGHLQIILIPETYRIKNLWGWAWESRVKQNDFIIFKKSHKLCVKCQEYRKRKKAFPRERVPKEDGDGDGGDGGHDDDNSTDTPSIS